MTDAAVIAVSRKWIAAALCVAFPALALAGESAATLYILNCMGCHLPPEASQQPAQPLQPLRGQFADSDTGRVFFITVPAPGARPLTPEEDARLLKEILDWRRSCSVILQQAPLVRYSGERHVK
ncbi:MAG: hypothetical protein LBE33_01285 [Zoogloeaceae bacterium]|nr:hypothetical protein [Zoogloeaceae bacterium]